MTGTDLAVRDEPQALAVRELSVEDVVEHVRKIRQVMDAVMEEGVHYGVIPGTDKPSLLKPGAEKLGFTFRLRPEFRREFIRDGEQLEVISYCSLVHIPTGDVIIHEAAGSCSTRESKYGYRRAKRVCPTCGADAIIKNRDGKTWQCIGGDKGGCWAKFPIDAPTIIGQPSGRVVNPDLADQHNTILKMADKRAHIAATLFGTGASDFFTQDLEDLPSAPAAPAPEPDAAPSAAASDESEADQPKRRSAAAETTKKQKDDDPNLTAEQKKDLVAKAKEKGMEQADLGEVVLAIAGVKFGELTQRRLVDVLQAVDSWDVVDPPDPDPDEPVEGEVVSE